MKKITLHSIVILVLMMCNSCQKYLDKPFDNRLEIKSVPDFKALTRQAYPTKYDIFTEVLTDTYYIYPALMQAAWKPLYTPIYLYQDDYEYAIKYAASPATAYTHFYNKIYDANYVIENIVNASDGKESERDVILAEALLIRAYCYFVLTNLFGKHYNVNSYETDLAVPLVTDINKENRPTYKRGTVKEAYQLIEADLYKAISIYEKYPALTPVNPYQFTAAAAYAFACRLSLYKGDYANTIAYANKTFESNGMVLRDMEKDRDQLYKSGWDFFSSQLNDPSTHPNIIMASQSAYLHYAIGNSWGGFYVDRDFRKLITDDDYRGLYKNNAGTVIDDCIFMVKNVTDWSDTRYILFGVEEVLLSRAEAYLKINTVNKNAALKDLEVLRKSRIENNYQPLPMNSTNEQVLEEILSQRKIELLAEGLRWYDIKRLGIRVEHKMDAKSETVDATLAPNDPRTALQIPVNARIGNPELENQLNPR
ncbi:hypothetical protein BWD42_07080 [Sphingobacterium sp. CZ-UAM]|uniref:RagB/SusD family nutrient uptake outer membrane protein n=1 Tax=Sphingobacterium sp. CZ-UAM TaxID=1933868 RepID=UPI000984A314|nr:RagB/SusD family nutrient uptake outer membrane protein [Sphingobacterium sp. CZ-UAM]OOG19668.1 hypothetical protein BWD42_07080 [Sphingobacterium sp. CZ-UAM]